MCRLFCLTLVFSVPAVISCDLEDPTEVNANGDGDEDSDESPGNGQGGDDEPAMLAGMTAEHNKVRQEVGVGPLVWDAELAAIAQAWAETCMDNEGPAGLIDHNPGRSNDYPGYVGENVYASSGTATAGGAVRSWASEKSDYDYGSNTCTSGKVCGHYTQIVWRDTLRVGCGISQCSGLKYPSTIVCNYSPGGNIGKQRPY